MCNVQFKEKIIRINLEKLLVNQEHIKDITDFKFMGVEWDGCIYKNIWYIFSKDGKQCWFADATENITSEIKLNPATPDDWMCIGPHSCNGFIDYDFKGCDFQDFDISGTRFERCTFDSNTFDNIITNHTIFVDCIFE
jgi:hypothetical protein